MGLPIHVIEKYLRNEADEQETRMVNDWFYAFDTESGPVTAEEMLLRKQVGKRIHNRLDKSIKQQQKTQRNRWLKLAAAAVVMLAIGTYFINKRNTLFPNRQPALAAVAKPTEPAAGNKATLILANGRRVVLNSTAVGVIDQEEGVQVVKPGDGKIAYVPTPQYAFSAAPAYNTIVTPNSGQYNITLSDGTKVWLNAASSLRYPVVFTGDHREVYLSGEGYFEVAGAVSERGGKIPFTVAVHSTDLPNEMKIKVLGTKFNVMGYNDEGIIETTLLEGKVETSYSNNNAALSPGLQSTFKKINQAFKVSTADMQQVLAWKNGEFRFNRMNIKGIMRQISRWYDVSVEYKGNMDNVSLSGVFPRKNDISELLDILETTGSIHCQLKGNKIIVSAK